MRRVTLDVGKLAGVTPDAIAFCFDIVAKGTALDGARLDINEIPGRCRCRDCGSEFEVDDALRGLPVRLASRSTG